MEVGLFVILMTTFILPSQQARAVCQWANVEGEKLGVLGTLEIPTRVTTMRRTLDLDTQETGRGIFFGYVGNQVKLTREDTDGRQHVYRFGTTQREMGKEGQTSNGDLSGKHIYQPGWLLLQTPMVTRIYACQPHKGDSNDFRMSGGQGAMWSTDPKPWINDVKFYRGAKVKFEASGYGVIWGGNNWNYVTKIKVDERWPCEMLRDFSLPAGAMAIRSNPEKGAGDSTLVRWDAGWGCR